MAYISLPEGVPGLPGLMAAYPEAQKPLCDLAEALLRAPSSLPPGERETIAAFVSAGNECNYCCQSHAAAARAHLGDHAGIVDEVLAEGESASVSPKLKALLAIADKVRRGGKSVTDRDVERARAAGADDKAIHDAVLIAAAFCMFNRYVDGLGTSASRDPADYVEGGKRLAEQGYHALDYAKIRGDWVRPA